MMTRRRHRLMNPNQRRAKIKRRPPIHLSGQNRKVPIKVRLIWTNCGVTLTANWVVFLGVTKGALTAPKLVLAAAMAAVLAVSSLT